MINNRLIQRPPPAWLFLGLPFLIFISTMIIYRESIVETIPEAVTQRITNTFPTGVSSLRPWKKPTEAEKAAKTANAKAQIPATIVREGNHDEYLAVCLFVRDQAQDLVEFFQHHYYEMGIRRFYVMDDGSNPPMSHYMDKFGIPEEAVDFIHSEIQTSIPQGMQNHMDDQCAYVWGVNNTWIAFIDADEFFDTTGTETIEDILHELETTRPDAGALGINWEMHTSSLMRYHVDSVRQSYLECIFDDPENNGEASDSKHIKSIVRTDAYLSPMNPHKFNLQPGFVTVGEHGDVVEHWAFRQPITRDRIALHHYVVKSFEDYADKITRSAKDWSFWNHMEYELPHKACAQMLKYFPHTVNKDGAW